MIQDAVYLHRRLIASYTAAFAASSVAARDAHLELASLYSSAWKATRTDAGAERSHKVHLTLVPHASSADVEPLRAAI